jgi:Ca2+:H+ antiporter
MVNAKVPSKLPLVALFALLGSLAARGLNVDPLAMLGLTCLGLATASALLGRAVENLAAHLGPRRGRLLDALLGSAAELILAVFALGAGLHGLVKASLTGSILVNLLGVLGLGALFGGLRHGRQYFDRERASHAATMLVLSVIALGVPTLYGQVVPHRNSGPVETLSEAVAVVMIIVFCLSIYYNSFWIDPSLEDAAPAMAPAWSRSRAAMLIPLTLGAIVILAFLFVESVPGVLGRSAFGELFLGIVIIPVVGNAAEQHTAIRAAWRNRMDLALDISSGASMRLALLVAPTLVFASLLLGHPMDLIFGPLELASMGAAVAVATLVAHDGRTTWLEGAMLTAVYVLMGLAFFWWPIL